MTPYAAGIMDTLTDSYTQKVVFQKPVQCGGTTIGENAIGAWIDLDPAPIMIVFSGEEVTKKRMREDITPLLKTSPRLAAHLTSRSHDVKTSAIKLRSCTIHTGWAGSAASLASVPIRYLVLDEVDKYPVWTGKESDAMSLGEMRTRTFKHRKKIYILSTPTLPTGPIARAIESCGDVRDWCPKCPGCEKPIRPDWEQVTWEGKDSSDEKEMRAVLLRLESGETKAHYTCQRCDTEIDSEGFWAASKAGGWVSAGCDEFGVHPTSVSVGFRLNGLTTYWTGVQGAAVEFASARMGGLSKIQGFYNSILGLPFWGVDGAGADPTLTITPQKIWDLTKDAGERGVVPEWATVVLSGVDTGKRDHPYVVRAFGPEFRSQLLEYGIVKNEDGLRELLTRQWHAAGGRAFEIRRMLIDSGGGRSNRNMTRTEQVYRFANLDPARVWAIKGRGIVAGAVSSHPIQTKMIHYRPPGDRYMNTLDVRLSLLDVGYWKDQLASNINTGLWLPHKEIGREYAQQMSAEHKVMVRQIVKPDGTTIEDWRWVLRSTGLPNHFLDCEVYVTVAAHMVGADNMENDPVFPHEEGFDDSGWAPPDRFTRNGSWI